MDKVEYTPWATLFLNTAKVYKILDHIDPKAKKQEVDNDVWEQLDVIVQQWIYGTIYTHLLLKILDEKATAMTAWNRLREIFQDNKGTRVVHMENQFSSICTVLIFFSVGLLSISQVYFSTIIGFGSSDFR